MSFETKVIAAPELQKFIAALFAHQGLSATDAAQIAEVMVWANLRGVDSHGVARVPKYLEWVVGEEGNAKPDYKITQPRKATLLIEADRAPGPLAFTLATDKGIELARETGVAWVGVRSTIHAAAVGYYAERAAKAGFIGIGLVAGIPNMGYTGVKGHAVATSPLTIGVPSAKYGTILLDMATATIALGKIAQYKIKGIPLPEGAALTKDGEPTTDAAKAAIPTPASGPKGSGMSLLFELLTSVLLENPIVKSFHAKAPGWRRHRQNGTIIVVDPSAFRDPAEFAADVDATVDAIKGLPRADENTPIYFPGEIEAGIAARQLKDGITLPLDTWDELVKVAESYGVQVPR